MYTSGGSAHVYGGSALSRGASKFSYGASAGLNFHENSQARSLRRDERSLRGDERSLRRAERSLETTLLTYDLGVESAESAA